MPDASFTFSIDASDFLRFVQKVNFKKMMSELSKQGHLEYGLYDSPLLRPKLAVAKDSEIGKVQEVAAAI